MNDRMLRAAFFSDEKINQISLQSQKLFQGLWCFADDLGIFPAILPVIRGSIFPYDNITPKQIEELLSEIQEIGLIIPFSDENKQYFYIKNWEKHQQIPFIRKKQLYLSGDLVENVSQGKKESYKLSGKFWKILENSGKFWKILENSRLKEKKRKEKKRKESGAEAPHPISQFSDSYNDDSTNPVESNLSPSESENGQIPLQEKKTATRGKQTGKTKAEKGSPKDIFELLSWVFLEKRKPDSDVKGIKLSQCVWFYYHLEAQNWCKEGKSGKMIPILNWKMTLKNWFNSGFMEKDEQLNYRIPEYIETYIRGLSGQEKKELPKSEPAPLEPKPNLNDTLKLLETIPKRGAVNE